MTGPVDSAQARGGLSRLLDAIVPWGALLLAPLLLLGPAVARGEVLFWGTPLLQFIPWRMFAWEAIREGYLPLWNPLVGMGAPLLANHQSALLYPPNWLLPLLGVAWGHGPLVIFHWMIAAIGMALLAGQLGVGRLGRTISGLAYGLSGYLVARAGFFSINAAAAWVPWVVLGVERLFRISTGETGWRRWFQGAVTLALPLALQWLAGHAQTAWYTLLLAGGWWLFRALQDGRTERVIVWASRLAAGGILAFLMASAQLLPTLEYLLNSHRAQTVDPELAMTYSFWPWRLLELLVPGAFGRPQSNLFWGYANYWEDAIYVGALPLLLAFGAGVGALRGRSDRGRLTGFLVGVSGLSLLLALGNNTPVFPWLFHHIPTFDLFQAPTRWNLLLVFSLALLAGFGSDLWGAAEGRSLYWLRLGTAGAGAVTAAAWAATFVLEGVRPTLVQAFALAGVWLFLAGILALILPKLDRSVWVAAVVAVVSADLLLAGHGLNPTTAASLYQGKSELAGVVEGDDRVYLASQEEYELTFYESFRFDTFHARQDWRWVRDVGLPNSTMLDGLRSADNFDPLLPARFVTWLETLEGLPASRQAVWLRLMGVSAFSDQLQGQDTPLYEEIAGASRARWVPEAVSVEEGAEGALSLMTQAGFDPDRQVVLEVPMNHGGEAGQGRVLSVENEGPGQVRVEVEADGNGWLVLSDLWYPGWRVIVDGEPAPLLRADYLFRAVPVSGGRHAVLFQYRPRSFMIGLGMSLVGILTTIGLWRAGTEK